MAIDILPEVPANTIAFAYRPYVTASAAAGSTASGKPLEAHQSLLLDIRPQPQGLVDGSGMFRRVSTDFSDTTRSNASDSNSRSRSRSSSSSCSQSAQRDCGECRLPAARIISRDDDSETAVERDGQRMAAMQSRAMQARIREAKRLVDDCRYEYACDVLIECQRGFNFLGKANFSTKLLHPMDPPPWCDQTMKLTLPNVHSFQLPDPSWQWVSPRWLIDMTQDVDEDGWQYASKFSNASWHGRHSAAKSFVRRRRWLRLRRRYRIDALSPCTDDADGEADDGTGEECYNEGVELPGVRDRRKRSKPVAVASKIKHTVAGNYVGVTPKSTTKASVKNLAFTLKDGKYRSHNLKRLAQAGSIAAAGAGAGAGKGALPPPVSMPPSPSRRRSQPTAPVSTSGEGLLKPDNNEHILHSQSAVQLLQRKLSANWQGKDLSSSRSSAQHSQQQHRHHHHHYRVSTHHKDAHSALPLPTGGMTREPMSPSYSMSAMPSFDGESRATTSGSLSLGYVDGVPEKFPRMRALMDPESTVPKTDLTSAVPKMTRGTRSAESAAVTTHPSMVKFPQIPDLQLPSASSLAWNSISRSMSTGRIGVSQSMPGSPRHSQHTPSFFRRKTTLSNEVSSFADDDTNSTVIDSRPTLPRINSGDGDDLISIAMENTEANNETAANGSSNPHQLLTRTSSKSTLSAHTSVSQTSTPPSEDALMIDFFSNDLPQLAPYVDPYRSLNLPRIQLFASDSRASDVSSDNSHALLVAAPPATVTGSSIADKRLLQMATDSLKSMLDGILLDRERLRFLHEGLALGGITAATIWYCLPWLHFELLQYDDARQRLIAMLLAFSHTCPLDVIKYFDQCVPECASYGISEDAVLDGMASEDRTEYEELVAQQDESVVFSPSQAWRFVIRPLAARDTDLFYSDFKVMVMGVARWSLSKPV
ncbi:hypothetical protein LPJ53_001621 [Coemansia erecta]|uniref:Peroxin/Ferlin domain-containing protein n=1 Tax=Coemansia erecta TaxID=147472 RepID=A0A9W7Y3N7_9FUNG|nr:hypothetical protein LPJ53_001621 [Coemansia erecta]